MSQPFDDALTAREFMLAGVATVTLVSRVTGVRFTYKIAAPSTDTAAGGRTVDREAGVRFVKVLTGSDNENDYEFLGTIFVNDGAFRRGKKSRIGGDAPSAVAFAWAWERLDVGVMPAALEVWHEGQCGRCGRKLTDPTSIASGFGPECRGKL